MRYWVGFAATPILFTMAWAADKTEVVEEIIAKVNGDIITRTDLIRSRESLQEELKRRKIEGKEAEEALKQREENFLRDRIDNLLLVQKGNQLSINVDHEVSKYMAELMLQFKVADQDKFAELVHKETGMRFEDFKAEAKNGLMTQQVVSREVGSRITIPREEVKKYYEDHKDEFVREERVFLREILVSVDSKDPESWAVAEKKAKALVERARRGEKFDELARENSDAVTKASGGDLGGWKKGELKKDIEALIWDKERNYVTDPIKGDNGFLILRVMAHHQAGIALLEEVENEIMGKFYGPRFEPKLREYLTELRQQAFLEIKDGWLDSAAAPGKDTSWTDPAKLVPETVTKEEVAANPGRRRLLWLVPIPGTQRSATSTSK
ncbi:MAG: peptidylprolyl isomerase [Bryobacteraceae bacterium]|nr:peptidylprolyl isomerase [Bryobacteraceae bacterium]